LIGMAATMGGTMRAPLTAMMFAIELTGDAALVVPLLAACGAAYALTVLLLKRSILTEKVARRGHHLTREYSIDPLDVARVADVMQPHVETLPADMTMGRLVAFFGDEGRHRAYPVVDPEGRPIALAYRADALYATRDPEHQGATLAQALGEREMPVAHPDEPVNALVTRMIQTDVARVPVIRPEDGVLIGLVARSDLLRVRANLLAEENNRTRLLRWGSKRRSV
jgi:CIC family chloride channel protein